MYNGLSKRVDDGAGIRLSGESSSEWYYWQRQTHLELLTLRGHVGSVSRATISPDGRRIVTGGEDQAGRVWDAASGREILTLKGHAGAIYSVGSAPDSRRIAGAILCAAFSPNGRRIVTGSHDQTARVWDAASGEQILTLKGHIGGIYSAGFSPVSRRIVTGSYDQTARVWDAASGEERLTLKGHDSAIYVAAFSPDGRRIVTASDDQTAKIWEAVSGKELVTLTGHSSRIALAVFSADSQRVVTTSAELSVLHPFLLTAAQLIQIHYNAYPLRPPHTKLPEPKFLQRQSGGSCSVMHHG